MRKTLPVKVSVLSSLVCFAAMTAAAQNAEQIKPINFRYSQNPKTKTKSDSLTKPTSLKEDSAAPLVQKGETNENEPVSIAKQTLEIAKRSSVVAVSPTEIYKVGVGDILFINLKNAPKDSTYYTVLSDGTIDYPLAGEMVSVIGRTTDEIEETLREKIRLYENPQISVGVRDYASHTITVLGLVEKAGEKRIQREAVPLYVVRAEALVQAKATDAIVRRTSGETETLNLKAAKSDEILIFPGDIVEFVLTDSKSESKNYKFYYIGGEILNGGQKEFYADLTLTQAIITSGGLKKAQIKKAVVRRKNAQSLLESTEYNLKLIKDGKQPDPLLQPGDTIEIGQ